MQKYDGYEHDFKFIVNNNVLPLDDILVAHSKDKIASIIAHNTASAIEDMGSCVTAENRRQLGMAAKILVSDFKIDIPVVIPMEMGLGKSTLLEEFLKYNILSGDDEFGAIVVKERIDDVLSLEEKLNGKAKAVYSFHPEHCHMEYMEYQRIRCRHCIYREECKIKRTSKEQIYYPIVIMTMERFRIEMFYNGTVERYVHFYSKNGKKKRRRIILIDEKPIITMNQPISRKSIKKVYQVFSPITEKSVMYHDVQELILYLLKMNSILSSMEIDSIFYEPLNSDYKLPDELKLYFKDVYEGNDVEILDLIASIIKKGAVIRDENINLNLARQLITTERISYKNNKMKTVIMDGTAMMDIDYSTHEEFCILEMPRIREYKDLTIKNCPGVNVSRTAMKSRKPIKTDDLFHDLEHIKGKEVLILSYLRYNAHINQVVKASKFGLCNKVHIDHFNNIKGKNCYHDVDVMILYGLNYKGDAYYIAKAKALDMELDEVEYRNKKVGRESLDLNIKKVTYSDMFCEILQNIFRIKIRKNKNRNSEVSVYSFITDATIVKMLEEYFRGCTIQKWFPMKFYNSYLEGTKYGQRIQKLTQYLTHKFLETDILEKKRIRVDLGYGKNNPNTLKRHLENEYVVYILSQIDVKVGYHNLYKGNKYG